MKINPYTEIETMYVTLDPTHTPIAYRNKIEELVAEEFFSTPEEAMKANPTIVIECEIYYEKHQGLFLVDSEAVGCSDDIYSPYTGEALEKE
jgi:hypothetical protein